MAGRMRRFKWDMGKVDPLQFSGDCRRGDWNGVHVNFSSPFLNPNRIRILITANRDAVPPDRHPAAVVAIASDVTSTGFELRARNSDCAAGQMGFHWIALNDASDASDVTIALRKCVLQPRRFEGDCHGGDWAEWRSTPFLRFQTYCPGQDPGARAGHDPHLVVGAGNLHVAGHIAAAVGVVDTRAGFDLAARSSDCTAGHCMFYYLGAADECDDPFPIEWWIDHGDTWLDHDFAPDCQPGDWFSRDVYFSSAFDTPPVVILTANDRGFPEDVIHTAAVVGVACDVTTHGFTLRARNSDCAGGRVGFYWVAVGCPEGCPTGR